MTNDENDLKETKLVNIEDQELEEEGIPKIDETEEGEHEIRLHRSEQTTGNGIQSKCLLSCYDMGGHTEYYNSQQVSNNMIAH